MLQRVETIGDNGIEWGRETTVRQRVVAAKAELKVLNWGNNLAVRIPSAVARAARLVSGQVVTVEAVDGNLVVKPQGRPPRMTLAQKLKAFDPEIHGGEMMMDRPVGKEIG